jgi:hypothetical protein
MNAAMPSNGVRKSKLVCTRPDEILEHTPLRNSLGDHPNWQEHYVQLIRQPDEERARRSGLPVAGAGFEPATSGL